MPDSNHILAEALARIEYKQDIIMKHLGIAFPPQLEWGVHMCPACGQSVRHELDFQAQVVKRTCGCKTGKQPFIVPEIPGTQGATSARPESSPAPTEGGAADRPGRQEGRPGSRPVR